VNPADENVSVVSVLAVIAISPVALANPVPETTLNLYQIRLHGIQFLVESTSVVVEPPVAYPSSD
jgi:hypothetical protein